jgi:hypothetical protein
LHPELRIKHPQVPGRSLGQELIDDPLCYLCCGLTFDIPCLFLVNFCKTKRKTGMNVQFKDCFPGARMFPERWVGCLPMLTLRPSPRGCGFALPARTPPLVPIAERGMAL